jgi:hypothetical protein
MSLGDRLRALDRAVLRTRPLVLRSVPDRLAYLREIARGRIGMLGYAEVTRPVLVEQAREVVALRDEVDRLAARVAALEERDG